MRPVRWSFHAQRTATKLAREVRGRMLGAWKRQTVAWLRPEDAGGVPIRTLSVTLDAVLVGGIATCSGVVTGWSPATVATFRTSGATVASGTITLDETGGYSFPLTVNPGATTIIVEAVDRGLVAHAADQVQRVLPALVVHVAASLDGTTMHITGWLDEWIDETTAAYVVAGGATGSGPVTLAPDRTFAFDVTGLGYGTTTVTITASDTWRSDDDSDAVEREAPNLIGALWGEFITTAGSWAVNLEGEWGITVGGTPDVFIRREVNGMQDEIYARAPFSQWVMDKATDFGAILIDSDLVIDATDPAHSSVIFDGAPFVMDDGDPETTFVQNRYRLHGRDGLGREFGGWHDVNINKLRVNITIEEWYGYSRSIHIVGQVSGYYNTPTVAYVADAPNAGSGAISIDGSGNFDFLASAPAAGTTAITITATEAT